VRAKHENGTNIESSPPASLYVSAVTGPAIMFFPRKKNVALGSAFSYSVQAEKKSARIFLQPKISLQVQANFLQVDSVTAGGFREAEWGNPRFSFGPLTLRKITVIIDVAAAGGAISGVSGSGALANLYCHAKASGLTMINFVAAQTAYRDTVGNAFP